ncbi:hypothetical protein GCM10022254_63170 [Actinomadura meridiana]|uniref:Uncharacterized protein n=1 Tax=Actinomadura meridiana TaxID=559626 RepID=A0ABP8CJC4_9ACTN
MLAFGPTRLRARIGGVSQAEIEAAFPDWELLDVHPADTKGLGWPMNRTSPSGTAYANDPEQRVAPGVRCHLAPRAPVRRGTGGWGVGFVASGTIDVE